MKKFVAVFVFFLLLSSALFLFWVSQIKQTQDTATLAKEGAPTTLPFLIDDCNVMFEQECQPPGGLQNTAIIHSIMDTILGESKNKPFATLKEKHLAENFPNLYGINEAGNLELSVADMMTRLTTHMHMNYKLLFVLMNVENNSFLSRDDMDPKHPFARSEESAFEELIAVSEILTVNMDSPPGTQVKVGSKVYQFEPNLNAGSKTVYSYLASTSTSPEIFDRKVKEFTGVWQKLHDELPLSKRPSYIKDSVNEAPLPTAPGEFTPTVDGDFQAPPASSSGGIEDLRSR